MTLTGSLSVTAITAQRFLDLTDSRCHVCRRDDLVPSNYAALWEVDHVHPRARGGSDDLSNLLPACVPCNRSKGARAVREARAAFGYQHAPLSREERRERALLGGVAGFCVGKAL